MPAPTSSALKLFISYSRKDSIAADAMVATLEQAGFEVVIDRRDLPYGEEWQQELGDFIHSADTIVWLVSPSSVASRWCLWELGEVQRIRKRLIPVLIGAVAPDDLPEALGRIHLLPAEGVYHPDTHFTDLKTALETDRAWLKDHTRLADRSRLWRSGNRNRDHLLRGSALNEAEHWRDRQPATAPRPSEDILDLILASRRAQGRRQRIAVAGSLVAAVFAVGLSLVALFQRNEALAARDAAAAAQAHAEAQQDRAERSLTAATETADGMIFQLAQQFSARGVPNEIVRAVLGEARKLQDQLYSFETNNLSLQRSRSVALNEYAKTLAEFGDSGEALALYREALVIARAMVAAEPENTGFQRDLSISLHLIGDITKRIDPEAASALYREALVIARAMVAAEPENTDFQRDLSASLERIHDITGSIDPDTALAFVGEALEIRRSLAAAEPANAEIQRELAVVLLQFADITRLTDPEAALTLYREALDILRTQATAEPTNTRFQRDLTVSLNRIGSITRRTYPEEALTLYREALAINRALFAAEPNNTRFQSSLSTSLIDIGDITRRTDPEAALALYREAHEILLLLATAEPENISFQRGLSISLERIGAITQRTDPEAALALFLEALEIKRALAAADLTNTELQENLSISINNLGVFVRGSNPKASVELFREALEIRRSLVVARPEIPKYVTDLAGELGNQAYYHLLSGDFISSEAHSREALELASELLWINTNLAHALMFQNKLEEADAIYLGLRGQEIQGKAWEEVILNDFRDLRENGLNHLHMAEIEARFAE